MKNRISIAFLALAWALYAGPLVPASHAAPQNKKKKNAAAAAKNGTAKRTPENKAAPAATKTAAPPQTAARPAASPAPAASATPATSEKPKSGAAKDDKGKGSLGAIQGDMGKEPTYIKSDSLTLKSGERIFLYSGNVEVKQGDMTLTSDQLEGKYGEDNKIQQLVASSKVVILKGENIKGTGERAVYDAATDTVTLTENPELEQNGSVLTADVIKIFLKDDRSTAEGDVRVKLVKKDGQEQNGILDLKK